MIKKVFLSKIVAVIFFTNIIFFGSVSNSLVYASTDVSQYSKEEMLSLIEHLIGVIAQLKAQASKSSVATKTCTNGNDVHSDGEKITHRTITPGSSTMIVDGYYVCSNGNWIQKLTSSNNQIGTVKFISSSASKSVNSDEIEYGKFKVKFVISAEGDDIFVSENEIEEMVRIEGQWQVVSRDVEVSSTAEIVDGYFVIKDGEKESFTVTVELTPKISGKYRAISSHSLEYSKGQKNGEWEYPKYSNESKATSKYIELDAGDTENSDEDEDSDMEEAEQDETSIWSIPKSKADILVVGVYEGGYSDGVSHSFGNHPQGEVTVDVSSVSSENTLLVLNSYEPVHWKITGANAKYIKGVLMTGYYDQKISGQPSGAKVVENTFVNGAKSSEYFTVYNGQGIEDDEFPELVEYLEEKTGFAPYLFFGGYSKDTVSVSVKG